MSSKPGLVLTSSAEWPGWYFNIKQLAVRAKVFQHIDPSQDSMPPQPEEPLSLKDRYAQIRQDIIAAKAPSSRLSADSTTRTTRSSSVQEQRQPTPDPTEEDVIPISEYLQLAREEFRFEHKKYQKKLDDIDAISTYIESHISLLFTNIISKEQSTHPYDKLRILKRQCEPSTLIMQEQCLARIRKLSVPPRQQNIDT